VKVICHYRRIGEVDGNLVTGDPKRTPSFVLFGNTDFWLQSGSASCGTSCSSAWPL
jgi:hypothetical protein